MTGVHVQAAPAPALRGAVVRLAGYRDRAPVPVRFTEMPGTFVPVILDLADGWWVGDARRPDVPLDRFGSFVAGLTGFPVAVEHAGTAHCVQVDLRPRAARRLLGVPMHELTGRTVALDDVLGAGARELVARVAQTDGWPARFALVQEALAARLADAPPLRPEVGWALPRIAGPQPARVGEVARELGWSHRRLIARFRDEVGMPPKLVARIARFERARRLIADEPSLDLARVAARCGFADQSHLSREVGELAATTPAGLRPASVNSVQDPAAEAA
ncbi:MAG TPA: helix-turn-helix domain-containing protein [Miltoncostaeaceae bacterium]|nr:helix-turn-helix domain-containing protein [Miltoncostaeaceae bacterium]